MECDIIHIQWPIHYMCSIQHYFSVSHSLLWSTSEQTGIILCDSADVVFCLHRCLHSMKLSPL